MYRQSVYYGEIPFGADILRVGRYAYEGQGLLALDLMGVGPAVSGFATAPTSPATLSVKVAPGRIYALNTLEPTTWAQRISLGGLAADTLDDHRILKQGMMRDTKTLSCPAPTTAGFSIVYLIQGLFSEVDSATVATPIYNVANPNAPLSENLSRTRMDVADVFTKAGTAAATGTQTAPTPDSGYVPLFTVTVAYGQTQITSPNIATASGAPFISTIGALTFATAAEIRARNSTKPVNAAGLFAAMATVALTDQATLVWDIATHGWAPSITLGGNRQLGAITGLVDNDTLSLAIVQDGTGTRLLTYDAQHDFGADGVPTLSTTGGKVDFLEGRYKALTGKVHWNFRKAA